MHKCLLHFHQTKIFEYEQFVECEKMTSCKWLPFTNFKPKLFIKDISSCIRTVDITAGIMKTEC